MNGIKYDVFDADDDNSDNDEIIYNDSHNAEDDKINDTDAEERYHISSEYMILGNDFDESKTDTNFTFYGGENQDVTEDETKENKIMWSDAIDINNNEDLYAKRLDQVRVTHNIYRDALLECYKIISNYIIKNKRILVGGTAIDNALRVKGSYLYDAGTAVDYDVISPDFHKDAYNIGQELAEKFSDISVIGARHITTMRVRYNYMAVVDFTYVPKEIYDNIPTIEYMGMRNIHPHYQMIDQHRSVTHGLENPPTETILSSRYEKDVKRYILLSKFYPIEVGKNLKTKLDYYEIPYSIIYGNCLGGYISAIYWLKKIGIQTNANISFSKKRLHISMPSGGNVIIITDNFKNLLSRFKDAEMKYYNAFLDKEPRKIKVQTSNITYEILDCKGEKIVAEDLGIIHIMGLSGTMMWLLIQALFFKNEWCLYLYKHLKVAFIQEGHGKYMPEFKFYGKYNWSDAYMLNLSRQLNKLGYQKLDNNAVPRNCYPEKGELINPDAYNFDPKSSIYYQLDGSECEQFDELELPS